MNRISKHYRQSEAFREVRQQALDDGFNAGREYEHDRLSKRWADDIHRAYWAGVEDAGRQGHATTAVWMLSVGLASGVFWSWIVWLFFGG